MKYNKSMIMKMAWKFKKENTKNLFSECLKLAWLIVKMEAKGFSYWGKYGHQRLYIDALELGLEEEDGKYYFDGEKVSKATARQYMTMKNYIDLKDMSVHSDWGFFTDKIKKLIAA